MQSYLTRRVFRAILDNEPLRFSHCRDRLIYSVHPLSIAKARLRGSNHISKRGLFAFPSPLTVPQNESLPSEAGLRPMRELLKSLSLRTRPPTTEALAKAFRDFFKSRIETPGVINGFDARLLTVTWKHLKARQEDIEAKDWEAVFSNESLENVLSVLSQTTCLSDSREGVQKVARFAFLELCADRGEGPDEISRQAIIAYITLLSSNGNPEEARCVTLKFWTKLRNSKPSPWLAVMNGFALKGDRRQLKKVTEELEKYGNKFDRASHHELTMIMIEKDLAEAARIMYDCPISDHVEPSFATKEAVMKFAILHSNMPWAQEILQTFPQIPTSETRDITLLWEAAHGSTSSGLSKKLEGWATDNPEILNSLTISCVNNLMEYANKINKPQLAVDFAALAAHWGFQPDIRTHMLRLESRIQAGDINGAIGCVSDLGDVDSIIDANLPLVNKLIAMLCHSGHTDNLFQQISSLVDPLIDNDVRLEADTVAALAHMLLYRHDWEALAGLLRPRLGSYDTEEKGRIRNSLTKFIMNVDQADDDIWEAYNLLRAAFPETGVSSRTDIMAAFFRRNRSDLACLVFGHMRQGESLAQRPKPDTYARCFQGIAKAADTDNLQLVHNMLKLDLEVDLDTRIRNALMLAYAACGQPEQSMEAFREILQSKEGPSHKTITVFFRVCETHYNGAQEAMKMMRKVKLLEIGVDRAMYTAYIQALAAHREFDKATEAIENMELQMGQGPNHNTIALFYNATPYEHWKDRVEGWAKLKYPKLWAQLESMKRSEHEDGLCFDDIQNEISV
ncbi:hypothetical protein Egran_06503 [Elaphomyces granulatus]|uniref:Pentacotripeptide-repeat region of PRORP domain-containing protein n=1 Tax=Elaphomyces granulatus TaxID=519963 RepID=A0A232LNI5_9EURO|nr:hypothetical protein Egran_06503 [Elaphomyces granulatus]